MRYRRVTISGIYHAYIALKTTFTGVVSPQTDQILVCLVLVTKTIDSNAKVINGETSSTELVPACSRCYS